MNTFEYAQSAFKTFRQQVREQVLAEVLANLEDQRPARQAAKPAAPVLAWTPTKTGKFYAYIDKAMLKATSKPAPVWPEYMKPVKPSLIDGSWSFDKPARRPYGTGKGAVLAALTKRPQRVTDIARAAGMHSGQAASSLNQLIVLKRAKRVGRGLYVRTPSDAR
jgi:hypothetical protein